MQGAPPCSSLLFDAWCPAKGYVTLSGGKILWHLFCNMATFLEGLKDDMQKKSKTA